MRSRPIATETGRTVVPVPESILLQLLGRFGFPNLPRGALEHIKYPIVVKVSGSGSGSPPGGSG